MITALHSSTTTRRPCRDAAAERSEERSAPRGVAVISAMSMSVDTEVRGMVRPRVPNFLIRRIVVGAVAATVALSVLVAVVGAAPALLGSPAVAAAPDAAASSAAADASAMSAVHVARSGDTLWSIADDHRGDIGRDDFVAALVSLNGGSAAIQVGQAVRLP